MTRLAIATTILAALMLTPLTQRRTGLRIGSKKFTESVILGEMAVQLLQAAGVESVSDRELGGSRLLYDKLAAGQLDAYPEYTGTLRQEILAGYETDDDEGLQKALSAAGISKTKPLGFNNTYALAVLSSTAEALNLTKISDLTRRPELSMSFSNEFLDRKDGWIGLRQRYGLSQRRVNGVDHDLAYRQLINGAVDVIDAYVTDAKLRQADVVLLEDDLQFFPRYDAVFLYRDETARKHPKFVAALRRLEASLSDQRMAQLNADVELGGKSESAAAASFLYDDFGTRVSVVDMGWGQRLWKHTREHLDLVRKSLIPAIACAIPLGIAAAKLPRFGAVILSVVGMIQTIPALALLVFLMPIAARLPMADKEPGFVEAVAALFLYSLLPIVRNTCAGLQAISLPLRESARALGVSSWFRLIHIELPLAGPMILAGIKTAAVLNIGFATLGALIGAGGYGQPILTGIRLNDTSLIMLGAAPAAAMALGAQAAFGLLEMRLVPRGLRMPSRQ